MWPGAEPGLIWRWQRPWHRQRKLDRPYFAEPLVLAASTAAVAAVWPAAADQLAPQSVVAVIHAGVQAG